jgi:hypothetical protein
MSRDCTDGMQHARLFSVLRTRCRRVPPIGSLSFGGLTGLVARPDATRRRYVAPGRRTVTPLPILGRERDAPYSRSRGIVVVPPDAPAAIPLDDTIERRWGPKWHTLIASA